MVVRRALEWSGRWNKELSVLPLGDNSPGSLHVPLEDVAVSIQNSILLKGWEQRSSAVGTEHSLSGLLLFPLSFVSSIL